MKQLIRKILKEESLKQSLMDEIKHSGFQETAKMIGGMDNLIKIMDINSPMDFLHLFDDMDVAQSEQNPDWTLFRYEPKKNLMVYDKKNKTVYINYYEIWLVLEDHFGLNYTEIQELTKTWLDEVHNLRGITTADHRWSRWNSWMRSTI
jgi:hypothetical protein